MFARRRHAAKEGVKDHQCRAASQPATEEFAQQNLRARHGFGHEREEGARFAFRRNLPRRGANGDKQRRSPNQKETNRLEITDNLRVFEKGHRPHHGGDQGGDNKQNIKVLAPIHFEQDNVADGKNFVHVIGALAADGAGALSVS